MNLRQIIKEKNLLSNYGEWYFRGPDAPGELNLRLVDLPRKHPLREYMGERPVEIGNLHLLRYVNQDILEICAYGGVHNFLTSVKEFDWKLDIKQFNALLTWARFEFNKLEQIRIGLTK